MADGRTTPRDNYQEVTDRIVAALEQGTAPWRRPWNPDRAAPTGPQNAVTGNRYHGVNVMLLGSDPRSWEFGDPRWCSYQQAKAKGWQVRGGEKATTIFFFTRVEVGNDKTVAEVTEEATKFIPVLRAYPVFHASQIDGIAKYEPPSLTDAPWRRPEAVDEILRNSGVSIRLGGDRAFYSPTTDHIQLPPDAAFASRDGWAATALHELGHATGHPSRLNRDLRNRFGSAAYAQEELRAELASVFMAGELGIPANVENHASYVDSWLKTLKNDKREIFRAAADAQRVADWCLSHHPEYKAKVTDQAKTADAAPLPPSKPMAVAASAVPASSRRRADGPRPLAEAMPEHLKRRLGMPMPDAGAPPVPDAAPAPAPAPAP